MKETKTVVPPALPAPVKVSHDPVLLTGDAAKDAATVLGVLARTDVFDRLAGEVELLRQLKPEQVGGVEKAYRADQAIARTSGFENGLLYVRMGQIGGLPYLEKQLPEREGDDLRWSAGLILEGWASVQPAAATAWLKTWPRWKSRDELARALIKGLGAADISHVEKFVAEADLELKGTVWPTAFSQLAGLRGIAPALTWGEKELLLPESKLAAESAKQQEAKRALLSRMLDCGLHLGASQARDLVSDEKTGRLMGRKEWEKLFKELARLDPVGTINWMQSAPVKREDFGNPMSIWTLNESWIEHDAASCARWMDSNPNHSLRDYVVWTYALELKRQDAQAATNLMMTMRNAKLRDIALGQLAKK